MPKVSDLKENILGDIRGSGSAVSGATLAEKYKVSGTAIWKHINNLRSEGYTITGSTRTGYLMTKESPLMIPEEIRNGLETKWLGQEIIYFDKVVSTNLTARQLTGKGQIKNGTVIIAEEQTGGKGRLGRQWSSPRDGLWMTMIIHPRLKLEKLSLITLITAVSIHQAITSQTGLEVTIKWPNDLLINGKKICGVLTEIEGEMDTVNSLYIGIGVNVNSAPSAYPAALRKTITTLKEEKGSNIDRKELTRKILQRFEENYKRSINGETAGIMEYWKDNCKMIGKNVTVVDADRSLKGIAVDIDDQGALILQEDSGGAIIVRSGDIIIG